MKWHLMSWRFLCCMLIACGYVHQQSSDEKYRKYFDHRLFQFKPLPLLPFLFHAYTYFQNTVLNFFSIGTFFFCIDKELCICSCCHHLISGFKRLSRFLDFFFLNAFCSFCCKPFCYSRGSVTELCKRRTYLCPKRMQFYCSLSFIFSVRNW